MEIRQLNKELIHEMASPTQKKVGFVIAGAGESLQEHPVTVPKWLLNKFYYAIGHNTFRGIETLGQLFGSNQDVEPGDAIKITHLLIPSQRGTDTTCTVLSEDEDLYIDWIDTLKLKQYGWIHTHPRFGCFMSPTDCHTQAVFMNTDTRFFALVASYKNILMTPTPQRRARCHDRPEVIQAYTLTGVTAKIYQECPAGCKDEHSEIKSKFVSHLTCRFTDEKETDASNRFVDSRRHGQGKSDNEDGIDDDDDYNWGGGEEDKDTKDTK